METISVGSVVLDFIALKGIVYAAIAIVLIVATKGRLGFRASSEAAVR